MDKNVEDCGHRSSVMEKIIFLVFSLVISMMFFTTFSILLSKYVSASAAKTVLLGNGVFFTVLLVLWSIKKTTRILIDEMKWLFILAALYFCAWTVVVDNASQTMIVLLVAVIPYLIIFAFIIFFWTQFKDNNRFISVK